MKKLIGILAVVMFIASVLFMGNNAKAYETLTAQETYNMLDPSNTNYNSNAYLIDVRTTEEYVWVGTCALPDGTTPYNIPWQIWAYQFSDAGEKVTAGGITVEKLFLYFIKKKFPEGTTLILMCRSGHRSTFGAQYLEEQLGEGYYTIYEIDNPLMNENNSKGGSGGFQGSSSVDPNSNGYRGYPERLPFCSETTEHPCVARSGSEIEDKNDSDSWMDTGLPMTQTVDKDKIWYYMWQEGY